MNGAVAAFGLFYVLFIGGIFGLWIWAIVDILKSEFTGSNKVIWLVAVVFIPLLGSILYFSIGRGQKVVLTHRTATDQ